MRFTFDMAPVGEMVGGRGSHDIDSSCVTRRGWRSWGNHHPQAETRSAHPPVIDSSVLEHVHSDMVDLQELTISCSGVWTNRYLLAISCTTHVHASRQTLRLPLGPPCLSLTRRTVYEL